MLPKNKRLKKSTEIDAIFKYGNTCKGSFVFCKYLVNNIEINRPAFSIAKNLKLKAFQKNRYRRQMINAYKDASSEITFDEKPCYDLFFILAKSVNAEKSRYDELKIDIKKLLSEIKCQKKS